MAVSPVFKVLGQPASPIVYLTAILNRSDIDFVPNKLIRLINLLNFNYQRDP